MSWRKCFATRTASVATASTAATTTRSSAASTCFTTRPRAAIRTTRVVLRPRARRDRRCARVAARRTLPSGRPREPYAGVNWAKGYYKKG
jgi:hypothetical protein